MIIYSFIFIFFTIQVDKQCIHEQNLALNMKSTVQHRFWEPNNPKADPMPYTALQRSSINNSAIPKLTQCRTCIVLDASYYASTMRVPTCRRI